MNSDPPFATHPRATIYILGIIIAGIFIVAAAILPLLLSSSPSQEEIVGTQVALSLTQTAISSIGQHNVALPSQNPSMLPTQLDSVSSNREISVTSPPTQINVEPIVGQAFPTTPDEAAELFGGDTSRWVRLEGSPNGWKFRPGQDLVELRLPNADFCIHYWDNATTRHAIGPVTIATSEATVYFSSYGFDSC